MLTFAKKYSGNFYSQNGEDLILEEMINRIKPDILKAVEFGAPDWSFCSNTAYLAEKGWFVKMYDINYSTDARIEQVEITPANVNEVVGDDMTVLSIDIDGEDFHVWKAYTGKPDIVVIEINSSKPALRWDVPGDEGCSYWPMVDLGRSKGYFLVCHTGNLLFCLNKYKHLFPEIVGDPILDWPQFFNTSFL
jgi:hypothetical protein